MFAKCGVMLALLHRLGVKSLDKQSKRQMMVCILQKGGYENDATGSNCELIVKLLPPPSQEVDHRHLTICASEAGLAG